MIKKISLAIIMFATVVVNAQSAKKWKLDKSHTSVNFSINHFFSAVKGNFASFDGDFYLNTQKPETGKIDFSIDVESIDTGNKKRNKHLQSKDFFNQDVYEKITFISTKIERASDKKLLVHGKLTIKDVTKDIILPMVIKGEMEHPMKKGKVILGVVFETKINRTDYHVGSGKWGQTMVVGDEVSIDIHAELTSKK